jgi:hypothetical protein
MSSSMSSLSNNGMSMSHYQNEMNQMNHMNMQSNDNNMITTSIVNVNMGVGNTNQVIIDPPQLLLQPERCLSIQEIVNICREFESGEKISRREFAKLKDVSRTKFDRYWKNYRMGKYSNVKLANKRRRVRPGKYIAVEEKLIDYLNERKMSGMKNDLSWIVLSEKAREIAKVILPEDMAIAFRASAGWLYGVLQRGGFIHVDGTVPQTHQMMQPPPPQNISSAPSMQQMQVPMNLIAHTNINMQSIPQQHVPVPFIKAIPKLTPQSAIVVNGDITMV